MKRGLLPVSEVFGPVWQGEGPYAGRLVSFIRLGLCNLSCEWCDTPFTWDSERYDVDAECPDRDPDWIRDQLAVNGELPDLVVISGGEPLLHQGNPAFKDLLATPWCNFHVETNGTIAPSQEVQLLVDHFAVSPKLFTHDPEGKRIKPHALEVFAQLAMVKRASWKIVCATPEEVHVAADFMRQWGIPQSARWIMPEGQTAEDVLTHARVIAPAALAHGLNLSLRQQTLMYGMERGR